MQLLGYGTSRLDRNGLARIIHYYCSSKPPTGGASRTTINIGISYGVNPIYCSEVLACLERRGIRPTDELVEKIFARAKQSDRLLTEAELLELSGQPIP